VPAGTRQRLLDAAWEQVRTEGIAGATSRAITTRAAANLGAITYHFGSKDALVADALVAAIRSLVEPALAALADQSVDPGGRVLNAVARLNAALADVGDDAPAYLEAVLQGRRSPTLQRQLATLFVELRQELAAQILVNQTAGVIPAWVHADVMAGLLIGVAQGVVLQSTVDRDGPSHEAMAAQFAQLLLAVQP